MNKLPLILGLIAVLFLLIFFTIYSLAIDPSTPTTIYAGKRRFNLSSGLEGRNVYALISDPEVASKLYAGPKTDLTLASIMELIGREWVLRILRSTLWQLMRIR
jgi:hypothetical protein